MYALLITAVYCVYLFYRWRARKHGEFQRADSNGIPEIEAGVSREVELQRMSPTSGSVFAQSRQQTSTVTVPVVDGFDGAWQARSTAATVGSRRGLCSPPGALWQETEAVSCRTRRERVH